MKKSFWISIIVLLAAMGSHLLLTDTSSGWRAVYDIVMKWVNFGIFVFVLVRFGKTPVMNFLHKQKNDLAEEIGLLEEEKDRFADKLRETREQIEKGEARMNVIKERIIKQGEKEKERIIEEARRQSLLMIEDSKKKAGSRILQTKDQLLAELVDDAVALAMERFPREVKENDNQVLLNNFLAGVGS